MKLDAARVLDRLPAEAPCLGAVFTSYGFDPAFFEDHVLRAILRLTSDPVEHAERYHHEARRALQETPVAAVVDAGERQPGRRLPYDLLEVAAVVFHPKCALLLYEDFGRLMVGSGNLTFPGYGGNTELFFCADLRYDDEADSALLRIFDAHLGRVRELVRRPGTQLDLVRDELARRLPPLGADDAPSRIALLDATEAPILDQLIALLPPDAAVESVGLLAPFYERDDARELDTASVLGALLPRMTTDATLDIGVAWDNPQVQASAPQPLKEGLGRLWTWAYENAEGDRTIEHLVPTSVGPNSLSYSDESGHNRRCSIDEVQAALEAQQLWMQPAPVAYAPRRAVASATEKLAHVHVWLHPASRLVGGRPVHRPLHAKLLILAYRAGDQAESLVLIGSPNMSRRALLLKAGPNAGNVEVALAFRLKGRVQLRNLVPELVHAPASAFELQERTFPELGPNHSLAVDEAVHDPRAQTLLVNWSESATTLPPWRLTYEGRELAASGQPPSTSLRIDDFVLQPTSAEVVLNTDGRDFAVPILVTDLVALPATAAGASLGLDELLLLLTRRVGVERAVQLAQQRATNAGEGPEALFGEVFGPTDVFRAWWSVAEDLSDPALSVLAFRLRLEGALGVGEAWRHMAEAVADRTLPAAEVWLYGAELVRTLDDVELPSAADRDAKAACLSTLRTRVHEDLRNLGFEPGPHPWMRHVLEFYGVDAS